METENNIETFSIGNFFIEFLVFIVENITVLTIFFKEARAGEILLEFLPAEINANRSNENGEKLKLWNSSWRKIRRMCDYIYYPKASDKNSGDYIWWFYVSSRNGKILFKIIWCKRRLAEAKYLIVNEEENEKEMLTILYQMHWHYLADCQWENRLEWKAQHVENRKKTNKYVHNRRKTNTWKVFCGSN